MKKYEIIQKVYNPETDSFTTVVVFTSESNGFKEIWQYINENIEKLSGVYNVVLNGSIVETFQASEGVITFW